MTTVFPIDGGAALTLAWVRSAWLTMTDELGCIMETRRVASADEAMLAEVKAAASGDGEAYRRIVERHQYTIARRMVRFTRDPRAIEELVHDVFVEAYFSLPRYRGDAPLEHWLQRIATRVGYRYWTRRGRSRTTSWDVRLHDPAVESRAVAHQCADEVAVVLERLAPRDRLVLTLLYLESRSVAEAADLAGWSESMIKVQAHRARKRFRKLLEESSNRAVAQGGTDG